MNTSTIYAVLALSLQLVFLVTARHLPYDDDLQADSLVLVNKTRRDISVEGSGDDNGFREIQPIPNGVIAMERMEAAPDQLDREHIEEQPQHAVEIDEGSGYFDPYSPETEQVTQDMPDDFNKEEGMEKVIQSLAGHDETNLETTDHNRHDNTLNVIAREESSVMDLEEPGLAITAVENDDGKEEGSGEVEEKDHHVEEISVQNNHTQQLENLEEANTQEPETGSTEEARPSGEVSQGETNSDPVTPDVVEETTIPAVEIEPTNHTNTEDEKPETTEKPIELIDETTPEQTTTVPTLIAIEAIDTSSSPAPIFVISTEIATTTEIQVEDDVETTVISETPPEITRPEQVETTTEISTELPEIETTTLTMLVEEINGTLLVPAVLGETSKAAAEEPAPQLEPKASSIGWYYVVGLLAVCLVILIAVVALRNRKRSHTIRSDICQDRDTEKSLLSNGRFKEDSEENNVKNNEIAPLVIKQNSQINKFEKSPNFSSPKNLNVQTHDKNIEKDNVLKSTQAIIDDEVDDAKKEVDDEEKKSKAVEESSPVTAEKVIVRAHLDLDSIPRKPIVINRNGHSYIAVPGGETKT